MVRVGGKQVYFNFSSREELEEGLVMVKKLIQWVEKLNTICSGAHYYNRKGTLEKCCTNSTERFSMNPLLENKLFVFLLR